ncbi:sugar phosphate isomerase/epimerase family protein [Nocardioides sp.]|uniref:sugar phosphate isomerase/epimerase family protein n=1 Tax=Nocardioides sp. TaxID=35761 RepID=UPI0039E343E1
MIAPGLHPRVCVSGLCFPGLSAAEAIWATAATGAAKTSVTAAKLRESGVEAVLEQCRDAGVEIVTTTGALRFDLSPGADVAAQVEHGRADIDLAAAAGATSLYTLTGPRVFDDWSDNADAYARIVGELVGHAAERGVVLALEPTNWLYADLNFVHSFRDALALAALAGMRVCLDAFHVWTESELRHDIAKHVGLISHVQLSDMSPGARALPCRALPGEGALPLRAVTRWLLESGYDGPFDLELSGPAIDEIGHQEAAGRAARWLDDLLVELGA